MITVSGTTHRPAQPGLAGAQAEVGLGEHGVEPCVEPAQGHGGLGAQGHHRRGRRGDLALTDADGVAGRAARRGTARGGGCTR